MKMLSILFITFTLSFSSNLLYLEEDFNGGVRTFCIDDDYYYRNNNMYFYDLRANTNRSIGTKAYQKILVIGGYEVNNTNDCIFDESKYLGLTREQYHYVMALYGVALSFLIGIALIVAV